jgi:hypothetical protein
VNDKVNVDKGACGAAGATAADVAQAANKTDMIIQHSINPGTNFLVNFLSFR